MVTTVLVPTMGAVLIAGFISSALYGATSMQTFNYFHHFGNTDRWGLKALVTCIWFLETVHVFLICIPLFRWLILDVDNPAALQSSEIPDDVTVGNTSLIILAVHCFYARRLWIMSNKSKLLVGIVLIIAFCNFGFEMVVMSLTIKYLLMTEWHRFQRIFAVPLALAAVDDIIIAGSMVYLLMRQKNGIKSTNALLTRMITYTVTTGILTSILATLVLICFLAMPNNLVFLGIYNCINNVYANSLLAMLNARESLREIRSGPNNISHSFQLSQLHSKASENTNQQRSDLTKVPWPNNEVGIETETTM